MGIPDLLLTGWIHGRRSLLRVWGPTGTEDMMSHMEQAFAFDIHIRRDVDEKLSGQGVRLEARDIAGGVVVYEKDGVKVTAFFVDHAPIKPAPGYRIDFAGHSVVLSGDTRYSENLIRFAQRADVLIHEVIDPETFRGPADFTPEQVRNVIAHYTTPEQAGTVFSRVNPKLAVYSHIVPAVAPNLAAQMRKTYSGPLEVGEDLMRIEISEQIQVHRWQH